MPAEPPDTTLRSRALLAGQNKALELAVGGAALPAVLEVLVRTAETQSDDGILASILLLDPQTRRLRHGAAPSLPPEYNAAIDGIEIGPHVGSCGTAAFLDRVTVVTDIASDPLWAAFRALALGHGLRACWSTPFHSVDQRVLGTFALYYREPRGPTLQDREVVNLLANTTAVVIERYREARERVRIEESLRRHAQMLVRVAAASRTLNAGLTPQQVMETLTSEARSIVGAHQACTWLAASRQLLQGGRSVALSNRYAAFAGRRPGAAETSISAHVARTSQPLRLTQEQLRQHPAVKAIDPQPDDGPPLRGCLAVPLAAADGSHLGVVQLNDKLQGDFSAMDEAVLTQLASIAAVSIEKAGLYASLQEWNELARLATDAGGLGLFTWDVEADVVTWHNDRPYEIFGVPPGEGPLNARRFAADFLHAEDAPAFATAVAGAQCAKESFFFQGRIRRRPDGRLRWVEFRGAVRKGADGRLRVVGTAADVSERRPAQEAPSALEQPLPPMSGALPGGDGRFVPADKAVA